MSQRQKYTAEFKAAVRLVLDEGQSCSSVSRDLGVGKKSVCRWVESYRHQQQQRSHRQGDGRDAELARLRQKNRVLGM